MSENEKREWFHEPKWLELREKIFKRDNRRCQICGASHTENPLEVHHLVYINDKGYGQREKWDYDERFLMSMCRYCHQKEYLKGATIFPTEEEALIYVEALKKQKEKELISKQVEQIINNVNAEMEKCEAKSKKKRKTSEYRYMACNEEARECLDEISEMTELSSVEILGALSNYLLIYKENLMKCRSIAEVMNVFYPWSKKSLVA